nr:hypothetical protein [uncultured Prevotella sp.]
MPITSNFSPDKFRRQIDAKIASRKAALIVRLQVVGEECLNQARSGHLYLNQTGNLCSSIGYCITDNGNIVGQGKWQAIQGQTGNGSEGKEAGMQYLQEVASREEGKEGITFIMVAGMPYAKYVEAMSLDVLDTSEQMAERKIREMLDKIFKK